MPSTLKDGPAGPALTVTGTVFGTLVPLDAIACWVQTTLKELSVTVSVPVSGVPATRGAKMSPRLHDAPEAHSFPLPPPPPAVTHVVVLPSRMKLSLVTALEKLS